MPIDTDHLDRLRQTYLAPVEGKIAAAEALRIERARLVLYGSLGVIAAAFSAVWASDRSVCFGPFAWGVWLLLVGAGVAWHGLFAAERMLLNDNTAAQLRFQAAVIDAAKMSTPGPTQEKIDKATAAATSSRNATINHGTIGGLLSSIGLCLVISAALATLKGGSCPSALSAAFWRAF
jgi:hypothetical protein